MAVGHILAATTTTPQQASPRFAFPECHQVIKIGAKIALLLCLASVGNAGQTLGLANTPKNTAEKKPLSSAPKDWQSVCRAGSLLDDGYFAGDTPLCCTQGKPWQKAAGQMPGCYYHSANIAVALRHGRRVGLLGIVGGFSLPVSAGRARRLHPDRPVS
jgi:hypothetical protein